VENKILNLIRMPELTLYNGDCLEIMKELPEKSVDLIICDLPYGCLHAGRKQDGNWYDRNQNGGEGCAWDVKIDLKAFWEQVRRIRKNEHTPTIHFCTTKFGFELHASNPEEFRYDLVWDKQRGVSFLSANKMPMRSHEMIYVFSKAGAFYNRVDIKGDFKPYFVANKDIPSVSSTQYGGANRTTSDGGDGKRCVLSVIRELGGNRKTNGHPTEKPIDLYRFLIERYCPPGGTVLDPTFGSGNSVFTAYEMGRNGIGIEKDEKFFEKAAKKLNDL
jgi:site-specific DNA-methyltransferase (adenine-specific)